MKAEFRRFIKKKYPKQYGRFMDCWKCDSLKPIVEEDEEAVYLECPYCGQGGKFKKPTSKSELIFYIAG